MVNTLKMDSIENNLTLLLDGSALQDSEDLCDFSLADQNEAIGKYPSPLFLLFVGDVRLAHPL